ncbi:DNA internalization-related competence protein ComEC/Rec2 [Staphylococcus sp. 30400_3112M30941]|nr:DNA internalization-related competence protein ComEC/Rec2 [Staphylococcus sp. 30403_3112M30944]MBO0946400.1 DNA internalization-related competence protein ComEC/Rec2 [Staphylococcus sp. 30402_3112M30943]MBO0964542.1 DNA internalization-related competence protein ComEC/Rec2 [Staphylococcus sp. 30400_3112M30941]MBO0966895.1 DNA internalization-related competence protein ComEC/Rec2 [Staphylococcus sp. 30401_3112M30942]
MFYIALSIIVGVLWTTNKVLSIFLFILLLLIVFRKNKIIFAPACLLLIIISSWYLNISQIQLSNHLKSIESNPQINMRVVITTFERQNHNSYKGLLKLNNETYPFYLSGKKSEAVSNIENYNCIVKGRFQINDNKYISIKLLNINEESCYKVDSINLIENHKRFIINRIHNSNINYPNQVIALITGDTKLITEKYLDQVKDLGIYHLLAVSGSHIAAIVFLIYQPLIRLNIPIIIIKTFTVFILVLFAEYTNYAPSAVRAIIMTCIILIIPNQIRFNGINLLSTAFTIMFISNPQIIFDIGFQFSFIISFCIILLLPFIQRLSKIQSLLVITFVAQLASFIILIPYFHQLQWIGFATNLIFVPYYSMILFPLSIIFFIVSHFSIELTPLNYLINLSFDFHNWLLYLFSKINHTNFLIPQINTWTLVVLIICIYYILWLIANRKFKLTFIYTIFLFLLLFVFPTNQHHRITMLNVGQGDSILYEAGNNQNVLIDTGGKVITDNAQNNFSISKYHILPTLNERGINKLEYLILTHPHNDHIGEVEYIMSHLKIKYLVIYSSSYNDRMLLSLSNLSKRYDVKLLDVRQVGEFRIGESDFTFLNSYIQGSQDKNEYSIVTLIKYHNKKVLLMGDATKNNEEILLKKYHLPKVDILKVGHHGSKTSSSAQFIEAVQPNISLISSGKNNIYRLPNKEIINRLKSFHSQIYDSQYHGQVTIDLDENLNVTLN